MKLIIVDFLRRWWGGYLLAVLFVGLMAAMMDLEAGFFFIFILLVPFLFELGRRPHGLMATLPVPRRTIALSYWGLAVILPALLMTGSVSIVGLLFHSSGISLKSVAITLVESLALAGSVSCLFSIFSPVGLKNDQVGLSMYLLMGVLCPAIVIILLLEFLETTKQVTVVYLAVLIGLLLTVLGYLRAERLFFGRARKYPEGGRPSVRSSAQIPSFKPGMGRFSGVFFNVVGLGFLFGLLFTTVLTLFGTRYIENSFFWPNVFYYGCVGSSMILSGGVRFLRSLPLSTGRLALNLLLMPLFSSVAAIAGVAMIQRLMLGHFPSLVSATFLIPMTGAICFACSLMVYCSGRANGQIISMAVGMPATLVIGDTVANVNWPSAFWWLLGFGLMAAAFFLNRHWLRSSASYRASTGSPRR